MGAIGASATMIMTSVIVMMAVAAAALAKQLQRWCPTSVDRRQYRTVSSRDFDWRIPRGLAKQGLQSRTGPGQKNQVLGSSLSGPIRSDNRIQN
jgi:hypothetical protein